MKHHSVSSEDRQSKSRRKREAEAVQQLGQALIEAPESDWQQLGLPERLIDALREAKHIHSHNARKRHLQFIGKLMRDIDAGPVNQYMQQRHQQKKNAAAALHRVEALRDQLIDGNQATIDSLLESHPEASLKQLRHLVRQVHREREAGHAPKSARALFRYLKELLDT